MKRFLKKICIAALLLSLLPILYITVFFVLSHDATNESYGAAMADKVERLALIEEPKIILVGDSNLPYGIDSETIEEAFDMPVVNMGLAAGMGSVLLEDIVKDYIDEGDIVIFSYHSYVDDEEMYDPTLAWSMLPTNWHVCKVILSTQLFEIINTLPSYIIDTTEQLLKGEVMYTDDYARSSFNEYGDIAYERTERKFEFKQSNVLDLAVSSETASRLNAYNTYCESVGATMLLTSCPIADGEYTQDSADLIAFQNELEEALDFPVISDFTDYLFDYDLFYNTYLHLDDEGTVLRTAQLIEDLSAVISTDSQ